MTLLSDTDSMAGMQDNHQVFTCSFPPDEILHQREFYIRPAYNDIFELILSHREMVLKTRDPKGLGIFVTGTPRTGKSVFLHYVATKLKELAIDIVTTIGPDSFDHDCSRKPYESFSKTMKNRNAVHLIDPTADTKIRETVALSIFFSSPTKNNYHPYKRKNLYFLYLPVLTDFEMNNCCANLKIEFSTSYFYKWGGVFMDNSRDKCYDSALSELLESEMLHKLLMNVDSNVLSPMLESCQWMLHRCRVYVTEEKVNYEEFVLQFPSDYVVKKIIKKIQSCSFHLPIDEANPILMGRLYEKAVIGHYSKIKVFRVQKFRTDIPVLEEKIINEVVYFTDKSVIKSVVPGTMFLPKESNKKGIDAVFIDDAGIGWAIQITMNKRHPAIDITSVLGEFPAVENWRVLLVTDPKVKALSAFSFPSVLPCYKNNKYIQLFSFGSASIDE